MPEQVRQRRKRRQTLTDGMVAALPRRPKRYTLPDPEQRGMYVRVMPKGPHVYAAVARNPYGKQVWATVGNADVVNIDKARDRARKAIGRIREGKPAFEPPPAKAASYEATAEKWLKFYVAELGLRSQPEIERLLTKHVLPVWGKRDFVGIGREEISDLLDNLVKERGAWTADHVLSIIRKIANWHTTRSGTYRSPFVVGMRRTKKEERERTRNLSKDETNPDDEDLRRVWLAAEDAGTFGAFVRVLLLTAQRRDKVARMRWQDITPDGVWKIPVEARAKGHGVALKLPQAALEIIRAQPKFRNNKYVFAATRGNGPLNGFNKRKAKFDLACGVTDWQLHDLRRTAKTLMSRAGVRPDISERVLGHKRKTIEGIYDKYDFAQEKADALAKVAALVDLIVNPPGDNVVPLHQDEAAAS
jgi:integrase